MDRYIRPQSSRLAVSRRLARCFDRSISVFPSTDSEEPKETARGLVISSVSYFVVLNDVRDWCWPLGSEFTLHKT